MILELSSSRINLMFAVILRCYWASNSFQTPRYEMLKQRVHVISDSNIKSSSALFLKGLQLESFCATWHLSETFLRLQIFCRSLEILTLYHELNDNETKVKYVITQISRFLSSYGRPKLHTPESSNHTLMDMIHIRLALQVEDSYRTLARSALRDVQVYFLLGLAPSEVCTLIASAIYINKSTKENYSFM